MLFLTFNPKLCLRSIAFASGGRIFHERAPNIPLIAISGYAFANLNSPAPDFLRMAIELGASRCPRKPFTPMALPAVINQCLSESRSRAGASQLG